MNPVWSTAVLTAAVCACVQPALAQATVGGSIRGVVRDKEFGSPVAGATISVQGSRAHAKARDDGSYVLPNMAAGTYTLIFTMDGYLREVKADVQVKDGQLVDVDAVLAGEIEDMEEFVVQDVSLGKDATEQQKSFDPLDLVPVTYIPPIEFQLRLSTPNLLDVVGVEMITKSGASDAASILLLVPGATLQDGKYAVIRGLPDRYVSTLLDGIVLPTADPDKRAVKLDQFPAPVIESIQVSKSFTPDQQGDSSGGAVNIDLKDVPEQGFIQVKAQIGTNSQLKRGQFLTYPSGGLSYFGNNDTLKTHPEIAGQSWPTPTGTTMGNPPAIYKWSVAVGDAIEVDDGVKVGAFGNFFYDQDASAYTDGQLNSLEQAGPGTPLVPEQFGAGDNFKTQLFDVAQGTQSVQWGGLLTAGIDSQDNDIGVKYLYTRLSEDQAIRLIDTRGKSFFFPGYDPNDLTGVGHDFPDAAPYNRLETLDYSKLGTQSLILHGEHTLTFLDPGDSSEPGSLVLGMPSINWRFALSRATENQPDQTQFAAYWIPDFQIFPGFVLPAQWIQYPPAQNAFVGWVQHINYANEESSIQGSVDVKLPFVQWQDREGYIKTGLYANALERAYRQHTFSNSGDPDSFYASQFQNPWSEVFPTQFHPINQSDTDISYDGTSDIAAFYAMADLPINETMNIVGGFRVENTKMSTTVIPDSAALWIDVDTQTLRSFTGPNDWDASFSERRFLPMLGWNWNIQKDLILRTAFAQTLARPNFFEIVPVLQYEYIGGPIFIGNPGLEMSALNNWDARLDWMPFENWLLSGSIFYKQIKDPIQYVQRFTEGFAYTTALNFPQGDLFGMEVESRITMDPILGEDFKGLAFGANFTWMNSEVTLPDADAEALAVYGFNSKTQPMTATPDYLLNLNCTYECDLTGTQLGVFYNYKGESLVAGANPHTVLLTPAIYQQPYSMLNAQISQKLIGGLRFTVQAKNLLNPEIETVYRTPDGFRGLNSRYTAGITFTFALSYQATF